MNGRIKQLEKKNKELQTKLDNFAVKLILFLNKIENSL